MLSPGAGGQAEDGLEGPGEVELVGVAAQLPDLIDAHVGKLQELGRPVHPVVHEKMLKGLPCALPEQFAQVISVQVAEGGDVLHRDGAAVILLDEGHASIT